ncbi:type IV secretory system conjugative DNA transfer family protein [Rhodobacteraceae bacterium]|nr:type IV secretory system conjugative DNA transfer family protein [Paracoccaceae bacterium]
MSNAQRHTHFLDSPHIAKVLSRSDFHFSDLRHRITSLFLVLPPNRMDAYSHWLRLLVSQALQDTARGRRDICRLLSASRPLSVKTPGTVRVTIQDGSTGDVTIHPGQPFPIRVKRVWLTGTTATGISGLV